MFKLKFVFEKISIQINIPTQYFPLFFWKAFGLYFESDSATEL